MNASTRYPWRKFYPGQYLTDPRMTFVSLAARGLLVDVESLCYCADPPGKLTLHGRPMAAVEIARLRGVDAGDVETAFAELLASGLLAKDKDGSIYSPALLAALDERDRERVKKKRQRAHVPANVPARVPTNVTDKSRVEKNRVREDQDIASRSPNVEHREFFQAFTSAFKECFGEDYSHQQGDFVQLAKWHKSHRDMTAGQFTETCRRVWKIRFHKKSWLTIRGVCSDWSTVVVTAKGTDGRDCRDGQNI